MLSYGELDAFFECFWTTIYVLVCGLESLLVDDDLARLCIQLIYACLYIGLMAHDYICTHLIWMYE